MADELNPAQLDAQKDLDADYTALKAKGFHPFFRKRQLRYMDQGMSRVCKKAEATGMPPPRASLAPAPSRRGPPGHVLRCLALLAMRELSLHMLGSPGLIQPLPGLLLPPPGLKPPHPGLPLLASHC